MIIIQVLRVDTTIVTTLYYQCLKSYAAGGALRPRAFEKADVFRGNI